MMIDIIAKTTSEKALNMTGTHLTAPMRSSFWRSDAAGISF
ncbi:hypothetical protein ACM7OQ_07155 [Pseudomonas aeruginosa]|nr:hypothetical protein [Pseudomonas aeruginosa]MDY1241998.1 hypothetical protein [Pseudomonas aeruginosa]